VNKKNIVVLGFMLFSLFFGAGNLIFPPLVGMQAGDYFTPAIIGFLLTAVCIPFLAVLSVSFSNDGLLEIGRRVSPLFGVIFAMLIYLSIGALYGIPRAASVAYELGFTQIFVVENKTALFIFTLIFFTLTYILSVDAKKMIDNIGKILTPALLIVLTILFVQAFVKLNYEGRVPDAKFESSPFLTGFLEGYFTMDAIAALAFGIVVINGLKLMGVNEKKDIIKGTALAGIISSIGLILVYLSLSWIGRVLTYDVEMTNGADILVYASKVLFGGTGSVLFGVIVLLACLTTSVGLTNACASFFHEIYPKLKFKQFVFLFVVVGMLITNLGLNTILAIATPILVFIYPFAIVLIILACIQPMIGESRKMYVGSMIVTSIFAILSVLDFFEIHLHMIENIFGYLPLYADGLGWVVPAFVIAIIGYIIDQSQGKVKRAK